MTISYYLAIITKKRDWYIYKSVSLFFGLTWYDFYPRINYNSPGFSEKRVDSQITKVLELGSIKSHQYLISL